MIKQRFAILHTIDTTGPGGAETVFLDLAQRLTVDEFDTIAVIKGAGWVETQLKARNIPYYIVKPHGFLSLPYYWTLFFLIRKHNVKLIQAHLLGSTLTFSILSLLLRIPLIATLHGQVDISPNEKHLYLKNKIMRAGVNRLIAVSRGLANHIASRKLFRSKDIGVIYNGVDIDRYGCNRLRTIRKQLQLDDNATLVGSVGNVRPAKSYDVLIQAADLLRHEFPNLHFVIAGHQKRPLMEQLQSQLDSLGLSNRVHFIGFHENTAEFLGQMDLFALSSSSEGFSIATIEAMASGLPAVVTRCGGPEEIIEHDRTGWMVAPYDPGALAEGLRNLIKDKALRARLSQAATFHATNTFSMSRMLLEYERVYMQLLPDHLSVRLSAQHNDASVHPKPNNVDV